MSELSVEQSVKEQIAELRKQLTGNLFEDGPIQQKIYDLKRTLQPAIEHQPELDDDEGCLHCGA